MDRKNRGRESVRVLLIEDDDKSCHLELARMLKEFGCDVTECKGAKDALDWLGKDTSRFDIMITERNLPDMHLLQKVVREMDLHVIDFEAMQNSIIHGASNPIPVNLLEKLLQYEFHENRRNPVGVQQPTNDDTKAQKHRFRWTPDRSRIYTDCVEELKKEGIKPTPKNIMERMEAKGVKGLTIAIVKSHKQKCDDKQKKPVSPIDMQAYNRPSPVHVLESMNLATPLQRAPAAMNISSQPHTGAPDRQSLPYPPGYLSNKFMTQIMTQPSSSRQICNDPPGGQAFGDGMSINASTNLLANNPQNLDFNEIVFEQSDYLPNFNCSDFSEKDALPDIDFEKLADYLPNSGSPADMQIP